MLPEPFYRGPGEPGWPVSLLDLEWPEPDTEGEINVEKLYIVQISLQLARRARRRPLPSCSGAQVGAEAVAGGTAAGKDGVSSHQSAESFIADVTCGLGTWLTHFFGQITLTIQ